MSERIGNRFAPSWLPACCCGALLMCAALYLLAG